MDEQEREARIAAMFRDAAAGAPPAGFDTANVIAASQRITRRRRSALAGGALAVLALAGVGVTAGVGGGPGGSDLTASSAGSTQAPAEAGAPDAARAAAPEAADAAAAPAPGASPHFSAGVEPPAGPPLGPGSGECADRQDPALRALVEQVLPEVLGAPEALTTMECRPGGERGVALEVRDGARSGLLSVTYLPPGTVAEAAPWAHVAPTASGGTVVVSSRAERMGEPPPFEGRLDTAVAYLAARL
jgi:hypothetical protein